MPAPTISSPYRGRFAPSPTGPLHFGSLLAALASALEARANDGQWLLRMEDVDAPRCSQAYADEILRTLEIYGFVWDGPLVWQRQRTAEYATALEQLRGSGSAFPCACTRRELADSEIHGFAVDGASLYPGTCRNGLAPGKAARAWRLAVGDAQVSFSDAVQGRVESTLAVDVGDFVLLRADNIFAYQLAVVVDDAATGITHIVRGADLLHSTARQIFLQQCLGLPTPNYAHIPIAVNAAGEKLSKQTGAMALDKANPSAELVAALRFFAQSPPDELCKASVAEVWQWAFAHWSLAKVPRVMAQNYNAFISESR
jgi:glutamyl-Q tRNA(Asp) synthetase